MRARRERLDQFTVVQQAPRSGRPPAPGPAPGRTSRRPGPAAAPRRSTASAGTTISSAVRDRRPGPAAGPPVRACPRPAATETVGPVVRRPVQVEIRHGAPAAAALRAGRQRRGEHLRQLRAARLGSRPARTPVDPLRPQPAYQGDQLGLDRARRRPPGPRRGSDRRRASSRARTSRLAALRHFRFIRKFRHVTLLQRNAVVTKGGSVSASQATECGTSGGTSDATRAVDRQPSSRWCSGRSCSARSSSAGTVAAVGRSRPTERLASGRDDRPYLDRRALPAAARRRRRGRAARDPASRAGTAAQLVRRGLAAAVLVTDGPAGHLRHPGRSGAALGGLRRAGGPGEHAPGARGPGRAARAAPGTRSARSGRPAARRRLHPPTGGDQRGGVDPAARRGRPALGTVAAAQLVDPAFVARLAAVTGVAVTLLDSGASAVAGHPHHRVG